MTAQATTTRSLRLRRAILVLGLVVLIAGCAAVAVVAFRGWGDESIEATVAVPVPAPAEAPPPVIDEEPPPERISTIIDLPGDPVFVKRSQSEQPPSFPINLPVLLTAGAPRVDLTAFLVSAPLNPVDGGFMGKFTDVGQRTADEAAALLETQAAATEGTDISASTALDGFEDEAGLEGLTSFGIGVDLLPENSNEVEVVIGGRSAQTATKETIIRVVVPEKISELLTRSGFGAETALDIELASKEIFNVQTLPVGSLAVARGVLDLTGVYRVTQFSIYENNEYVGSLALADSGGYREGAEPFLPEDLFLSGAQTATVGQYTLADGIYSAGLRGNVPEPIIRDAVLLVAKLADVKQPIQAGQTLRLLYSREARDKAKGTGRVIYVGLSLPTGSVDCYVFQAGDGTFRCVDKVGAATGGGGLFAPVPKGIRISSVFGMRMHPILKILRLHAGTDWATPIGTPLVAVAPGKVKFAGVQRGFGNHVRVQHQGFETSYSHLSQFAPGIAVGTDVTQGQLIAFSGNSGLSTGPHLHFQYYLAGTPVDPLLHLDAQTAALDTQETTRFTQEKQLIDKAIAEVLPAPEVAQ